MFARPKLPRMRRVIATAFSVVMGVLSIGLSSTTLAAPPMPDRFDQLRAQDLRVATVAYRLATTNTPRCAPDVVPQLGFVLHSIAQYRGGDRPAAARRFGLGRHVGVMAVVGDTPAQNAGLHAGDHLLAVNGRAFADRDGAETGRAAVDRVHQALVAAMQHGEVTLTVSSAAGIRDVRFRGEPGCSSNAELVPDSDVNAWADGSRVIISDGLLRRCASDDELALVIGHEMAHNLLRHRQHLAADGVPANGLLPAGSAASRAIRETEEAADRLAVVLATAAAYDLSGAEAFIGGLMAVIPTPAKTHPDLPRRLALLRAAIADTASRAVAS